MVLVGAVALRLRSTRGHWHIERRVAFDKVTVGAYVENLFDDHSITYVHPEAFVANRYATQRPRTIGVRVSFDF